MEVGNVYCVGRVIDLPPWVAALMHATNPHRQFVKPPSSAILKAKYEGKDQAPILAIYESDWWNFEGTKDDNDIDLLNIHSEEEERAFLRWIQEMGEVFSDLITCSLI